MSNNCSLFYCMCLCFCCVTMHGRLCMVGITRHVKANHRVIELLFFISTSSSRHHYTMTHMRPLWHIEKWVHSIACPHMLTECEKGSQLSLPKSVLRREREIHHRHRPTLHLSPVSFKYRLLLCCVWTPHVTSCYVHGSTVNKEVHCSLLCLTSSRIICRGHGYTVILWDQLECEVCLISVYRNRLRSRVHNSYFVEGAFMQFCTIDNI